jgi:hypothetical protein
MTSNVTVDEEILELLHLHASTHALLFDVAVLLGLYRARSRFRRVQKRVSMSMM